MSSSLPGFLLVWHCWRRGFSRSYTFSPEPLTIRRTIWRWNTSSLPCTSYYFFNWYSIYLQRFCWASTQRQTYYRGTRIWAHPYPHGYQQLHFFPFCKYHSLLPSSGHWSLQWEALPMLLRPNILGVGCLLQMGCAITHTNPLTSFLGYCGGYFWYPPSWKITHDQL